MGGVPCIRNLRIPVATVVDMLADGMSTGEILKAYPDLEPDDIRVIYRDELVGDDERSEPSGVEKILRVRPGTPARLDQLSVQIAELERLAVDGDVAGTLRQLGCIVPAFQPGPSPASATTAGLKARAPASGGSASVRAPRPMFFH